ncbi:MAG: 50S ribosomal protein L10 [Patescibacteria group bacterium]|nr:50S ribosomal protein L10 [Patescibacteria group bacterium]
MARTKEQKKEIVEKLGKIMDDAKSLVFVNIHGLPVSDATAMRKKLKADKVGLFVAKKTLTGIALEAKKYEGSAPDMPGELALAYGDDLVAPARGVYEFQGKLKDKVTRVGGVFDGKYMNKEEMTAIAAIPPLKTLYGMFVNVINSPIQGLAMALDQIAKKQQPA